MASSEGGREGAIPPASPAAPVVSKGRIRPCRLCGLLVGHSRQRHPCGFCDVDVLCTNCTVLDDPTTAGLPWCGECETKDTITKQACIENRGVGAGYFVAAIPGGDVPVPPGNKGCYICNRDYGLFRWKVQCFDCRRLLCDSCVQKASDGLGLGGSNGRSKMSLCPICFDCRAQHGYIRPPYFEEEGRGIAERRRQRERSQSVPNSGRPSNSGHNSMSPNHQSFAPPQDPHPVAAGSTRSIHSNTSNNNSFAGRGAGTLEGQPHPQHNNAHPAHGGSVSPLRVLNTATSSSSPQPQHNAASYHTPQQQHHNNQSSVDPEGGGAINNGEGGAEVSPSWTQRMEMRSNSRSSSMIQDDEDDENDNGGELGERRCAVGSGGDNDSFSRGGASSSPYWASGRSSNNNHSPSIPRAIRNHNPGAQSPQSLHQHPSPTIVAGGGSSSSVGRRERAATTVHLSSQNPARSYQSFHQDPVASPNPFLFSQGGGSGRENSGGGSGSSGVRNSSFGGGSAAPPTIESVLLAAAADDSSNTKVQRAQVLVGKVPGSGSNRQGGAPPHTSQDQPLLHHAMSSQRSLSNTSTPHHHRPADPPVSQSAVALEAQPGESDADFAQRLGQLLNT